MISNNPDLYEPFWICTTLIFVASSIGTFVTYVAHKLHDKEWNYDINVVTWSAGLFYGYVAIVPLCFYVILKSFSTPSGLGQLFCLYGYSLFVFILTLAVSDPGHVTVKFQESNLQMFPSSQSQGKISISSRPLYNADDTFSKPISGSEDSESGGWFRAFIVVAYKPYFDVDTSDVLERIKESLFPFKRNFTEVISNDPDLYGPFWICTKLMFVAASIGTFVTYVAYKLYHKEWNYDINVVTWSAGLFYGYVGIVPLCLYVILSVSLSFPCKRLDGQFLAWLGSCRHLLLLLISEPT